MDRFGRSVVHKPLPRPGRRAAGADAGGPAPGPQTGTLGGAAGRPRRTATRRRWSWNRLAPGPSGRLPRCGPGGSNTHSSPALAAAQARDHVKSSRDLEHRHRGTSSSRKNVRSRPNPSLERPFSGHRRAHDTPGATSSREPPPGSTPKCGVDSGSNWALFGSVSIRTKLGGFDQIVAERGPIWSVEFGPNWPISTQLFRYVVEIHARLVHLGPTSVELGPTSGDKCRIRSTSAKFGRVQAERGQVLAKVGRHWAGVGPFWFQSAQIWSIPGQPAQSWRK